MGILLGVDNLNVFYGVVQALYGVSFYVDEGEIVTIVGANGAGKTTTLETIAGLIKPTSGEITFGGEKITNLKAPEIVKMGISLVPEGREIFPDMTVLENLEVGAFYIPQAKEKMKDTLDVIWGLFPVLKDRKKQVAGTLSGGEQQMLAIARGLMAAPRLLMLDEPSVGLAPKIIQSIFSTIREINSRGVTILLVEQNVRHSLLVSDRAYVLETGNIILEGRGEDLLDNDYVRKAYLGV